jgi:hypothetical protein
VFVFAGDERREKERAAWNMKVYKARGSEAKKKKCQFVMGFKMVVGSLIMVDRMVADHGGEEGCQPTIK